jgi:nucleoside-diphosphate-sugar epimerase
MKLPERDLHSIVGSTAALWEPLRRSRVLVTGATGFFGVWLIESLIAASRELDLGISVLAQSRNPGAFLSRWPHFRSFAEIEWIAASPVNLSADQISHKGIDAVVHLVTEADNAIVRTDPAAARRTIVGSTETMLSIALASRARYFLFKVIYICII